MLPPSSRFKFTPDLEICRVLNGMWQVSGAHGYVEPELGVSEMFRYHEAGFTTWDLADHYGPAEDFVGEFRSRLPLVTDMNGLPRCKHSPNGCRIQGR